ncbi:GNAT family N-acetyltransferase [Alteromonadaceae bacterium BrNp21-10]|nr:GNAT family N-acetyltransferase [Alteromonadaceae bacterium BrNp21-10]
MSKNSAMSPIQFVVEPARPSQTAAVLTLLPELLSACCLPSSFIIAFSKNNPSQILGAAAFIPQIISNEWPGFSIHCHVVADFRRQGIGSAMLQQLKTEARHWDIAYLHVTGHFEDNSSPTQFLTKRQFSPSSNMHYFIGQTQATLPMLDRLVKALYRRNRVPTGFSVQPLAQVNLDKVAELFARQFGTSQANGIHIVQQALSDPLSNELSLAVSNGSELAGFLIAKQSNDFPEVSYWVSAPEYRQGWPAALLLEGFVRGLHNKNIPQGGYSCNDKTTATLNIARKTGAQLSAIKRSYVLNLDQEA